MELVLVLAWFFALPLGFLHALLPFWLERGVVALQRRQWRAALSAVGGIALPFAWLAALPYLLERAGLLELVMPGVTNASSFGLLFGLIRWPFVTFRYERRASTRPPRIGSVNPKRARCHHEVARRSTSSA
jgi:hypothetical protein